MDIEGTQVGMQSGVLDRHQIGRFTRFVMVRVPIAGWGDERTAGLPRDFDGIDKVAIGVGFFADEGVASRFAIEDQVDCYRLVGMWQLIGADG